VALVFTCNHCPVAKATEDRLNALHRDYANRGVALIAISSNETVNHPTDDLPHRIERAKEKGFHFPYLFDETQEVAKAYGAQRTPHFFVLGTDRRIAYTGAIDDSPNDASQAQRHYVRETLDAILAGRPVSKPRTEPVGCNVKWKGKDAHWMPKDRSDFV
jgi:peroxiredoxin